MCDAISLAERLAVTLRFLATSILDHLLCERHIDVSIICFARLQLLSFILYALAGPVQYTESSNHLQIAQVRHVYLEPGPGGHANIGARC